MSIITISTIVITLFTISFVLSLQVGLKQIISSVEKRIDLSVYFFPIVTDEQAESVITAIKAIAGVEEVNYITKDMALAGYKERAVDSPELLAPLEVIGDNPFGASAVIRAAGPEAYAQVIEELGKPQYRDLIEGQKKDYEDNRKFIDSFSLFAEKIRLFELTQALLFISIM